MKPHLDTDSTARAISRLRSNRDTNLSSTEARERGTKAGLEWVAGYAEEDELRVLVKTDPRQGRSDGVDPWFSLKGRLPSIHRFERSELSDWPGRQRWTLATDWEFVDAFVSSATSATREILSALDAPGKAKG